MIGRARFMVQAEGASGVAAAFSALGLAARERVEEAVRDSGRKVGRGARQRAPRDTGKFRRSIRPRYSKDGLSADVAAWWRQRTHPLSHIIEFGSAPHTIRPKRKKALAFAGAAQLGPGAEQGPRQATVVREVKHPGTAATPFLFPAWEEERPNFTRSLAEAINESGREVSGKWGSRVEKSKARRIRRINRRRGVE